RLGAAPLSGHSKWTMEFASMSVDRSSPVGVKCRRLIVNARSSRTYTVRYAAKGSVRGTFKTNVRYDVPYMGAKHLGLGAGDLGGACLVGADRGQLAGLQPCIAECQQRSDGRW